MPGEGEPVQGKDLNRSRRPPAWERVAVFVMSGVLGLRGACPKHSACLGQARGSLEVVGDPKHMDGWLEMGWCAHVSLVLCRYPDIDVLERGIKLLIDKQLPNGDWPQVRLSSGLSEGFLGVADVLGIVQPWQRCALPYLAGKPRVAFGGGLQKRQ